METVASALKGVPCEMLYEFYHLNANDITIIALFISINLVIYFFLRACSDDELKAENADELEFTKYNRCLNVFLATSVIFSILLYLTLKL